MKASAQFLSGARNTSSGLFGLIAVFAFAQNTWAQDEKGGETGRFYEVQEAVGDGTFQTTTLWEPIEEMDEGPDVPESPPPSSVDSISYTPVQREEIVSVGSFLIVGEKSDPSTYTSSLTLIDDITLHDGSAIGGGGDVPNLDDRVDLLEPGLFKLVALEVDDIEPAFSLLDFADADPSGVTSGASLGFGAGAIPEPSRLLLTLLGLGAVLVRRRR